MEYSNKIKNAETLRNVFLATPLTIEGQNSLIRINRNVSKEEFLDNCYVHPFTSLEKNTAGIESEDFGFDFDDSYWENVNFNRRMFDKERFEANFYSSSSSLFLIKGMAGSGKTTYLNNLLLRVDNGISYICDFEKTRRAIRLLDGAFDMGSRYEKTIWKFISIVLPQVDYLLCKRASSDSDYCCVLENLSIIYKNYFVNYLDDEPFLDDKEFRGFFDILQNHSIKDSSYDSFGKDIRIYFEKLFCEHDDNPSEAIKCVFGILMRLFFCFSKTENYNNKRFICAIDNIERYIDDTLIQDAELKNILTAIKDALSDFSYIQNRVFHKTGFNYLSTFAIIVAMRDTSVNLSRSIHFFDEQLCDLDISDWFDSSCVFSRKTEYFSDICNSIENDTCYTAFRNIISDFSISVWSSRNLVTMMYNHNHRRIANNVIIALARSPESVIELYNRNWTTALREGNRSQKYLCRMLVFRILLNYSQEKNYLDRLLLANVDAHNRDSVSYARKITSYLQNKAISDDGEVYISFPEIIKSILQKPFFSEMDVSETEIKDLANVLFTMSLSRSIDTNWNALIVIKFGYNTSCSANELSEKMICLWKEYTENKSIIENTDEYAIKITTAGNIYAQIVPTFEYYACRSDKIHRPLIAITNNNEFEELLSIVMKSAFSDIDSIIKEDMTFIRSMGQKETDFTSLYDDVYWLYKSKNRNSPDVHPMRIIKHHIGYLENYREYIQMKEYSNCIDLETVDDMRGQLQKRLNIIDYIIQKYLEKAKSIENLYPHYLNPIKYVRGD